MSDAYSSEPLKLCFWEVKQIKLQNIQSSSMLRAADEWQNRSVVSKEWFVKDSYDALVIMRSIFDKASSAWSLPMMKKYCSDELLASALDVTILVQRIKCERRTVLTWRCLKSNTINLSGFFADGNDDEYLETKITLIRRMTIAAVQIGIDC